MKCPYCGKELLSQAVICDGCGAKVGNSEEPEQNTNNQQNIENIYQPQNSNNKSGILVLFLFLAGIVVVSYFLFFISYFLFLIPYFLFSNYDNDSQR